MQLGMKKSFIRDKLLEILQDERTEVVHLTRQHFLDSISMVFKEDVSFKRLNDKLIVSVEEQWTTDFHLRRGNQEGVEEDSLRDSSPASFPDEA